MANFLKIAYDPTEAAHLIVSIQAVKFERQIVVFEGFKTFCFVFAIVFLFSLRRDCLSWIL